ncbi:hypothetical protein [Marinococcus luteus]|nr:hypothetical protein [Marinococcus luteus]MDZ5782084.1 hypothetical protein [Marinococcus luteus]
MNNQELVAEVQEATGASKNQILEAVEVLYEQNRAHKFPAVSNKEKA